VSSPSARHFATRAEIEQWEREHLAPYAALSAESRGRVYPQTEHTLRTAFQRDRDRIIHSAAFRRLEYKTQVFIPHERDHYRTRLTHTIEVAQISRTLARSLRLNEDLAEAVALVHDLGHTPFGHAGEEVLNDLIQDWGGFNHNRQSLRVVDILEQRYPEHPGLNLTYEVREGIVKHETTIKLDLPEFDPYQQPTLEASLVDMADEIAYNSHDIDDGISSGLISLEDFKETDLGQHIVQAMGAKFSILADDYTRYALVRRLVDVLVTDVIEETQARLDRSRVTSLSAVRTVADKICAYSEPMERTVTELKEFLRQKLYCHLRLVEKSTHAHQIITTIYEKIYRDPKVMPTRFQKMLISERREIVIADYIAGMTDRFAVKVYEELK
jgi:dGTPase